MAIFTLSSSFLEADYVGKCLDLLFDKYGVPKTITTGEDAMNHLSRWQMEIPGIEDESLVRISFVQHKNGTVTLPSPEPITLEQFEKEFKYKPTTRFVQLD